MQTGLASTDGDGQCDPGFTCDAGNIIPYPDASLDDITFYDPKQNPTPNTIDADTYIDPDIVDENGDPIPQPVGDVCGSGGYCDRGSKASASCQPGTFNPNSGSTDTSSCQSCTPGKYCSGQGDSGSSAETGNCEAGFYCTGGSDTPRQVSVPAGYYSLAGADDKSPCLEGTYQSLPVQDHCEPCPDGFYCPS